MSGLPYDEHFEQLAAGYFDQVLDDAGQAELKALLQADGRRVKRFAELAQLNQMITSEIAYQHQAERFGLSVSPDENASTSALTELASLYEDGLQSPVNFATWREEQANKAAADRRKVWMTRTFIGSAVAAALLLTATLLAVVFTGDPPEAEVAEQPTDEPDATSPNVPGRVGPALTNTPVATLTAQHNAQWAERALARGSVLHPGTRLTLTEGFAEITTNRGAIAILEAPATIELIDSPNALRLHTGKLVGICETESSKGFLVRTPHMDIIDLGTRFGVHSTRESSEVHVFEGDIHAQSNASDAQPMRLARGQSLAVAHDGPVAEKLTPARFVQQMPASRYETVARALGAVAYLPFDEPPNRQGKLHERIEAHGWVGQLKDLQGASPALVSLNQSASGKGRSLSVVADPGMRIEPGDIQLDQRGTDYTIALWIKPDEASGYRNILTLTSALGPTEEFSNQLVVAPDGTLGHYVFSVEDQPDGATKYLADGVACYQSSRSRIGSDRWTHVAISCSSEGELQLYVNGVRDADPVSFPGDIWRGTHYAIACQANTRLNTVNHLIPLNGYRGAIDELVFFNQQLSDRDIASLFQASEIDRQAGQHGG